MRERGRERGGLGQKRAGFDVWEFFLPLSIISYSGAASNKTLLLSGWDRGTLLPRPAVMDLGEQTALIVTQRCW